MGVHPPLHPYEPVGVPVICDLGGTCTVKIVVFRSKSQLSSSRSPQIHLTSVHRFVSWCTGYIKKPDYPEPDSALCNLSSVAYLLVISVIRNGLNCRLDCIRAAVTRYPLSGHQLHEQYHLPRQPCRSPVLISRSKQSSADSSEQSHRLTERLSR